MMADCLSVDLKAFRGTLSDKPVQFGLVGPAAPGADNEAVED